MQLGMIGLGRMGGNIVRRLMRNGHTSVVYDKDSRAVAALAAEGATGAGSLEDFVARVELVQRRKSVLGPLAQAARQHVLQHFNREKNLVAFSDLILANISATPISRPVEHNFYENPVLQ